LLSPAIERASNSAPSSPALLVLSTRVCMTLEDSTCSMPVCKFVSVCSVCVCACVFERTTDYLYDTCRQHLRHAGVHVCMYVCVHVYACVCLYVAGVKHQVVCMTFAGSTCGMQLCLCVQCVYVCECMCTFVRCWC